MAPRCCCKMAGGRAAAGSAARPYLDAMEAAFLGVLLLLLAAPCPGQRAWDPGGWRASGAAVNGSLRVGEGSAEGREAKRAAAGVGKGGSVCGGAFPDWRTAGSARVGMRGGHGGPEESLGTRRSGACGAPAPTRRCWSWSFLPLLSIGGDSVRERCSCFCWTFQPW